MAFMLVKKKIFPNVHVQQLKFRLACDDGVNKNGTIIPAIMQDEGLGDPNSKYTNPESASFAETNEPNCYPDSRVNFARINCEMSLTKDAIETDKVQTMKVMVAPISISFLEDLTAKDEKSTNEVEDVLELQHETTDRQTYPLWNGTKLTGDSYLETGSNVPGLTTNTNLEAITFDPELLYDGLQYYTNGGKIRNCIGKIRWLNLSRNRNLRMSYRITRKAKRMNPYTFFGLLIYAPKEGQLNSTQLAGDLTNINHIQVRTNIRYNEWNENFNFMR